MSCQQKQKATPSLFDRLSNETTGLEAVLKNSSISIEQFDGLFFRFIFTKYGIRRAHHLA